VALIVAPILIGATGIVIERLLLKRLQQLDHLYGLILTFGLALIIEGVFRNLTVPRASPIKCRRRSRAATISASCFLPNLSRLGHTAFSLVGVLCDLVRDRAHAARLLPAAPATENPTLVRAFGINVPRMVTLTYGFGVGLAGFSGVHGRRRSTMSRRKWAPISSSSCSRSS